jgi:hypothetical protein
MKGKSKKARGKRDDFVRGVLTSRRVAAALGLLTFAFCLLPSAQAAWSKQKTGSFASLHAVFFVDALRGWAAGGCAARADRGRN